MRSRPTFLDPESPPRNESVWQTAKRDLSGATGLMLLAVVGLLVWMAFQWGFGNDAVLPTVAANAFDLVDDGASWSRGAAGVGAAMVAAFVFWGASQLLDAVIMLSGLRIIPRLTQRISHYLTRKNLVKPYDELSWTTRWGLAYATGVSVICLVDVFATGRPGLAGRRRMILASTLLSAGTVSLVVGLVVSAAMVATRIPAVSDEAEVFISVAKNPLTWIGLFSVLFVIGALRKKGETAQG